MFKKSLTLFVTLVLLLALVTACAGDNGETAPQGGGGAAEADETNGGDEADEIDEITTLSFLRWGSDLQPTAIEEAALAINPDLAARMRLEVTVAPDGTYGVARAIRLSLAAGETLPDIVQLNYDNMPEFAQAGVLRDLGWLWEDYLDAVSPAVLEMAKWHGTFYNIPGAPKTRLWFYRADIFEEAGIDAHAVRTLDDFIAAGRQLQEVFPDSFIDLRPPTVSRLFFFGILSELEVQFADADGNYILVDQPGFIAAMEAVKAIYDADILGDLAEFTPEWENAFAEGHLVATINFDWLQRFLPDIAPDQASLWSVAQVPSLAGGVGGSDNFADIYVFFYDIENFDLAIEYVRRIRLDHDTSLAAFDAINLTPILNSALDDERFHTAHPFFGEAFHPQNRIAMDNILMQQATPSAQREGEIIMPYVDQFVRGEISLEEALASIDRDLNSQIGNAYNPR